MHSLSYELSASHLRFLLFKTEHFAHVQKKRFAQIKLLNSILELNS